MTPHTKHNLGSSKFNIHIAIGHNPLDCARSNSAVEPGNQMDLVWFGWVSSIEFDWLRNQPCTKFGV